MKRSSQSATLRFLTEGGVIAALYAALTMAAGFLNLAYGPIQFRFSEALTVLPVFTPAAVPGLFLGCILGNVTSPLGWVDVVCGATASLLAAWSTRKLRQVCWGKVPILAPLPPVFFNALIVGAEITLFSPDASFAAFLYAALTVGLGQLVVCYGLGLPLYFALRPVKHRIFGNGAERG